MKQMFSAVALEIAQKHVHVYEKAGSVSLQDIIAAAVDEAVRSAQGNSSSAEVIESLLKQMEDEFRFIKEVHGDPMFEHGFEEALHIVKQAIKVRAVA
jgi:hypothetical protein